MNRIALTAAHLVAGGLVVALASPVWSQPRQAVLGRPANVALPPIPEIPESCRFVEPGAGSGAVRLSDGSIGVYVEGMVGGEAEEVALRQISPPEGSPDEVAVALVACRAENRGAATGVRFFSLQLAPNSGNSGSAGRGVMLRTGKAKYKNIVLK